MKATEQYFPGVLSIMMYQVVLTFDSVDGIPKFQMKSTELYFPVVPFFNAAQGASNFLFFG